jgi:predicted MFS family arabinose efflux permease
MFIALPGGMLGNRFGGRRVVLAGLALMVAGGALSGASSDFTVIAAGRLVSGIGAVLMNVMLSKLASDWFAGREIATAMGILVSSWPLGLGLGLLTFPPIAAGFGWAAVMHAGAVAALAGLLMFVLLYRDPPGGGGPAFARLDVDLLPREWLLVSIAGAIWGVYNVSYIVLVSFVPALLTARGYTIAEASQLTSLLGWVLIFIIPIGGYLAQSLRRPNLVMLAGFALVVVGSTALAFAEYPLVPFLIVAVSGGLPAGLIMALPVEALRPQARASGMGVYFTCYYALMAALPPLAGMARDMTGSPAAPILFAAAMILVAAAGLAAFRIAFRPPPVSA